MEYAVIATGGKQYLVKAGDNLKIEKLSGDLKEGDAVIFGEVLLLDNGTEAKVGTPHVSGAQVKATIAEIGRGKKIEVVKYKAKSRYFKLRGHRQPFMKVKIETVA